MPKARHHNVGPILKQIWVDAFLQAARGGELEQSFLLSEMTRIGEHAPSDEAVATLSARFSKVEQRVVIEGAVEATMQLTCQRCLQPVQIDVSDDFNVVIVPSESELSALSESQDAIVADPTRLDLAWLTEEQLLLAVPLVPLHENEAQCGAQKVVVQAMQSKASKSEDEDAGDEPTRQRPFAALRELMNKPS